MTGVSGPLLDTFFLGGKFDRRAIVATKATCQVASHFTKLVYFVASSTRPPRSIRCLRGRGRGSMLGTSLARRLLEAMTDLQFRTWAGWLITTVASY